MHPHLFEISLPTPAWLAGMSPGSCRPKWREKTEWLPTARKRGQHLGIYQKTRMCLFICLFILHLKSGYCSNWIRGKDLSPLRSLGLAAPFSRDGSHKTMSEASCPPMRKPLVLLTSAFYPVSPPSLCSTLRSGGRPSRESSCRPEGRVVTG